MTDSLTIFVAITILFFVLLIFKELVKREFCVICTSIMLTWIGLLIIYQLGFMEKPVLLAILLGQSITGLYYLIDKKVKEEYHIFRLPFFLTLTFLFYLLIEIPKDYPRVLLLLGILWLLLFGIFVYKQKPAIRQMAKKLIECCKGW